MKKAIGLMMTTLLALSSCSKKNTPEKIVNETQTTKVQELELSEKEAETEIDETQEEPHSIPKPEKEEKKEEMPTPVPEKNTKKTEEKPKPAEEDSTPIDEEYTRSVGTVAVTKDKFVEDKTEILRLIEKLSGIMKAKDYRSWLDMLDDESKSYWTKPANLKKAQARLPVKGIKLKTMEDYFKYIFIPARQGRTITEIRYISDKYVKAIEMRDDVDYVYYYFNKVNERWMLHLPALTD